MIISQSMLFLNFNYVTIMEQEKQNQQLNIDQIIFNSRRQCMYPLGTAFLSCTLSNKFHGIFTKSTKENWFPDKSSVLKLKKMGNEN